MKKHSLNSVILIFTAALLCFGCNKEDNGALEDTPIIEAYLMAEGEMAFKVTHQVAYDTDGTYILNDFSNLDITVFVNDTVYLLSLVNDSIYSNSSLIPRAGDQISFSFELNEKEISGATYIPSKSVITSQSATSIYVDKIELDDDGQPILGGFPGTITDPIEISWENLDGSYYLVVVENIESDPEPVRDFGDDEDAPVRNFRKAPTNSAFEQIRDTEFQYFGTHRVVLYHVLADYADLYDEINSTSQNLSNPSSNISNAYGIFTGLNSDTIFIEVIES